jgi:hypothetical protein
MRTRRLQVDLPPNVPLTYNPNACTPPVTGDDYRDLDSGYG